MDMVNTAIKGGATGEANYVKALILIANKMYSEANEEIAKALSVNGGSQKYILARATAFIRSMDFSRGLDDANAVLAANPDSVEARLLIAEGFLATSADSEAEAQLDEVDKKGKYGQAYRLRGQLAKKRGNADEAKNMYKDLYYDALEKSSAGWHENDNGYNWFMYNFLSMLYLCYKELDKRFAVVNSKRVTKKARIEATVLQSVLPISKKEVCEILPDVSPTTVEAVL